MLTVKVPNFAQSSTSVYCGRSIFDVPEDAELAVLKGAVLFGHKPDYIVARIVRHTYGVRIREDFNPDIHEPGRCVVKKWNENV
jgi:hypothetical protein